MASLDGDGVDLLPQHHVAGVGGLGGTGHGQAGHDRAGLGAGAGLSGALPVGDPVVLPIPLLVIGQASGMVYFSLGLVLLSLVLWVLAAALLWFSGRALQRSELIARL